MWFSNAYSLKWCVWALFVGYYIPLFIMLLQQLHNPGIPSPFWPLVLLMNALFDTYTNAAFFGLCSVSAEMQLLCVSCSVTGRPGKSLSLPHKPVTDNFDILFSFKDLNLLTHGINRRCWQIFFWWMTDPWQNSDCPPFPSLQTVTVMTFPAKLLFLLLLSVVQLGTCVVRRDIHSCMGQNRGSGSWFASCAPSSPCNVM